MSCRTTKDSKSNRIYNPPDNIRDSHPLINPKVDPYTHQFSKIYDSCIWPNYTLELISAYHAYIIRGCIISTKTTGMVYTVDGGTASGQVVSIRSWGAIQSYQASPLKLIALYFFMTTVSTSIR